jgi:hypothetical protein
LSNAALPPAFQLEEKKNKNKNLKGFEPLKAAAVSLQQLFRKKERK